MSFPFLPPRGDLETIVTLTQKTLCPRREQVGEPGVGPVVVGGHPRREGAAA